MKAKLHYWFDQFFCKHWADIERLGQSCSWHIKTSGLHSSSIVYCAGVGKDISFEHALVKKFGLTLYLFDPSPTGLETMALRENRDEKIQFYPLGLAGRSGALEFGEPAVMLEGSYTIANENSKRIVFDCTSVADFMQKQGHDHIDLLKMDIEGCEYEVLNSILQSRLSIRMICCEFHHFLKPYSRLLTLVTVLKLKRHGYSLIYKNHHDYTFFKVEPAKKTHTGVGHRHD